MGVADGGVVVPRKRIHVAAAGRRIQKPCWRGSVQVAALIRFAHKGVVLAPELVIHLHIEFVDPGCFRYVLAKVVTWTLALLSRPDCIIGQHAGSDRIPTVHWYLERETGAIGGQNLGELSPSLRIINSGTELAYGKEPLPHECGGKSQRVSKALVQANSFVSH